MLKILLHKEKKMTQLTRYDVNALSKALVGFDRMFDDMDRRFATQLSSNYPPFNISKTAGNLYDIAIAVTGFDKEEITLQIESNELTVRGERKPVDDQEPEYLHRGLALRDFEKTFTLAEHMKVRKAEIKNGILLITIEREIPEEMKPRLIDIIEVK
jgi:molecular chaperone IbpA